MRLARLRKEWKTRTREIRTRVELGELLPFEALGEYQYLYTDTVSHLVNQILGLPERRKSAERYDEARKAEIRAAMGNLDRRFAGVPVDIQHIYVAEFRKDLTFTKAAKEARLTAMGVVRRLRGT